MERKQRAVLCAGLLVTGGALLAGALHAAWQDAQPLEDQPATVAFRTGGPDVDGDGRPDYVRADGAGVDVVAATGTRLLAYGTPVLRGYQLIPLGGEYPMLFVQTAVGEWAGFTYDPGAGLMRLVTWPDGRQRGYGSLTPEGALVQAVAGGGSGARSMVSQFRLEGLHLQAAGTAYQPVLAVRSTPSEALSAAVEAVGYGLREELRVHFAEPEQAESFYRRLRAVVPSGAVLMAQADEVNAGAQHGHRVPVTIWVSTHETVVGLQGEAQFAVTGEGARIQYAGLGPVPLKVDSWEKAAALVKAHSGTAAHPTGAPFYGIFRLEAGGKQFAVEARTGEVESE